MCFQEFRKAEILRERHEVWCKRGANLGSHILRAMSGIPSRPGGLDALRARSDWRIFLVPIGSKKEGPLKGMKSVRGRSRLAELSAKWWMLRMYGTMRQFVQKKAEEQGLFRRFCWLIVSLSPQNPLCCQCSKWISPKSNDAVNFTEKRGRYVVAQSQTMRQKLKHICHPEKRSLPCNTSQVINQFRGKRNRFRGSLPDGPVKIYCAIHPKLQLWSCISIIQSYLLFVFTKATWAQCRRAPWCQILRSLVIAFQHL